MTEGPRRQTRQRSAVLALLDDQDGFRTAQDLHALLRERGEAVGLATVYRALQALMDDGLVDAFGPRRLTLISAPGASLPARELQELGVARVSTGPFTQRVALTALQDATAELLAGGALPAGTRNLA